ncbi:hypothetical protein [Marinoscillum furvescens]|uniref:Uncharacterized protein n=1 Tax=Marinoscillum furvescens DSM 4134 TaxID=1122208 RepID=A0A3D9KVX9_MARFU|nr:hypothetical protein [Marinoscillum furvescens]RED91898.1 hypothetical protein C7460_13513 [Marinoscillum furvescens DSM 4134]
MAHYAVVNILKYENNKLYFSDDDSTWDEIGPHTITGYPKQNELMIWFAGPGVDKITGIDFDSDDDFVNPPRSKFGKRLWFVKVKPNATVGDEPKYTIRFKDEAGNEVEIDPKVKVKPAGGG